MFYIVPTPIGNLEDISLRALRVLKEVDYILAEDTRQSIKLLQHYSISKPLHSYHQHNEHKATASIINDLQAGKNIALISDAGTPGISDPGFLLSRACVEAGIAFECLPGATAFVPALVQSGFPITEFVFIGFLPQKKGRQKKLQELAGETRTLVLYESPFRILKMLEEFNTYFSPERKISISRELTKMFEETFRGTLEEAIQHFTQHPPKGEFVIVLEGI